MTEHAVVPHDDWLEARKALLAREKEFSRQREALAADRRSLPWEAVTKEYVFEGPAGKRSLPDLFDGFSQLIVYHFMFPPEWDAGCPHCSAWARGIDAINGTYQLLDLVPKGRDEPADGFTQFWVRRHDEYGS